MLANHRQGSETYVKTGDRQCFVLLHRQLPGGTIPGILAQWATRNDPPALFRTPEPEAPDSSPSTTGPAPGNQAEDRRDSLSHADDDEPAGVVSRYRFCDLALLTYRPSIPMTIRYNGKQSLLGRPALTQAVG